MAQITPELVGMAYAALSSGNRAEVEKYWHKDVRWLLPSHHPMSGWYQGLDEVFAFSGKIFEMCGGNFSVSIITVMGGDDYSADITRNVGQRAGQSGDDYYVKLDIEVVHLLRWRDGKIVEVKSGIFGDGATQYEMFLSPVTAAGERV